VGADAMMADLIPQEKRTDAYSLLRMSNNVGVAIGPAVGGFIATTSYTLAFYLASIGMITYALLVIFQAKETLPQKAKEAGAGKVERLGGYDKVLRDKQFVLFCIMFTLTMISSTLIWVLMAVYAKQNFQVSESQYGLIPTTNAVMVITLQIWVTSMTKRHNPFKVLAFGGFLYALGVGSVAWGTGFWGFWISIIIMTVGELIMTPTATTMVANLAPADMRGRYMSIYSLTWSVAQGIGPVLGGFLNDNISPMAIWYGGGIIGMISVLGFLMMYRSFSKDAGAKSLNSAAGQ
jgi:MFS family permease